MGSEVDHHQLTQERDQLRQQLAEANAALNTAIDRARCAINLYEWGAKARVEMVQLDNVRKSVVEIDIQALADFERAVDLVLAYPNGPLLAVTPEGAAWLLEQIRDANAARERAEKERDAWEQDAQINDGWLKRHAMERDEAEDKATYATTERDNALADLRREAEAAKERAEAEAANLYKQRIDAKLCIEQLMAEAGVMRKTLEEIAASTAGDDEPGDRSPRRAGWECVQRARAVLASGAGEKAAAVLEAAVLRAELKRISDLARQGDIVERGVLGDIADAALASGAGEKAAAVLAAVRCLLAARSWDVMGQEFLALKATFAALEKGGG